MHPSRWEAGSMYHWEDCFSLPVWNLPSPAVFYLVCRHAIAALCASQPNRPTLWLPTFFCPEVARFCRPFAEIREFRDDCRWAAPDWASLQPRSDDLVLAVNYFGVRDPGPWQDWRKDHPCILVEDHTQDPFSSWSLHSSAEYVVCSLRKTLPVPDGAIVWSPVKRVLPKPAGENSWRGSMLKLSAMMYKRSYLDEAVPAECKLRYRELQLEGEKELGMAPISSLSPASEAILARGIPRHWREIRAENALTLLRSLEGWNSAQPVFSSWPAGHAPFDLPLVFKDMSARDRCQSALQRLNIFCPVEWVCDTPDRDATELSSRILSIPIDHRYTTDDMARIASALWSLSV